jgi:hypothetical protein
MPAKPTILVLGMMARTPFAGVAWQGLHYLEGFRRLGYDVYYIEDTGDWPYDPEQNAVTADCGYPIRYLARLMDWCGLPNRWAYRGASQGGRVFGLPEAELLGLYRRAAALVNLTGATVLREDHLRVPVRIYLETDPVLPQIEATRGRRFTLELLGAHTHHFTFGENIGTARCAVPAGPFTYRPTRQPIILDWWDCGPPGGVVGARRFTTVASWQQSGKDVVWNGETFYWSKHHEFLKFIDLPRRTPQVLELALARCDASAAEALTAHGWRVSDALSLSRDILPYRDYVRGSAGEFTVAKDQNIRLRSGWFSDRSACYLAAGRPVITQDTGFGNILPTGRGLFAFRSLDDARAAVEAIERDYTGNCRAARAIAAEYFAAERVLGSLLVRAGL